MADAPTVFIVEDDQAVRDSLKWLVESVDLQVEAFDSAKSFLEACDPERPGCLVLDVRMPGMSGVELQKILVEKGVTLPKIIITGYGDVPTAVRAMRQGAVDFLQKPIDEQAMLELIQHCIERDADTRRKSTRRREIKSKIAKLTPREQEVMDLVVVGKSNKEVARALGISPKTVEVHRGRVMEKMRADSLADLVQMTAVLAVHQGKP